MRRMLLSAFWAEMHALWSGADWRSHAERGNEEFSTHRKEKIQTAPSFV